MTIPASGSKLPSPVFPGKRIGLPGILWGIGLAIGSAYLLLPGYVFLIVLVSAGLVFTGFIKPEYTFYVLIFILVVEKVQFFITFRPIYQATVYPYIAVLLVTVPGLVVVLISGRGKLRSTPVDVILWIIVVCEIISMLWAPSVTVSAMLAAILFANFMLFYVVTNTVTSETVLRRSVSVMIAAGIVAATGIILSQWIDVSKIFYLTKESGFQLAFQEHVSRPAGLAGVDHVAGFVSMSVFMALGTMAIERRRKVKALYLLLIIYMVCGIILTTSRGVIIGLVGAYIFFSLVHSHFKGKFLRYGFIFLLIIILTVLAAKPGFIDRMLIGFGYTGELIFSDKSYHGTEASTETGEGLSGMEMRKIWWANGLREMEYHPWKVLVGLGIGGFITYSAGYNTVSSPEVNSISFSFFYDMGVIGVILLLLLSSIIITSIYYCLKNAEKNYTYYMFLSAVTALIAETGIHGLVDYDLYSYGAKFFWFPLGLTMAIYNMVKEGEEKSLFAKEI